ncbi:hypothetical protein LCGC14_0909310 [marine sediment metagenome]|uniref:Uncharacterized protein n=1 Tax=marine sediment metagenome TaxID=412755 RepID=A0A0F9NYS1_9ZZZZ
MTNRANLVLRGWDSSRGGATHGLQHQALLQRPWRPTLHIVTLGAWVQIDSAVVPTQTLLYMNTWPGHRVGEQGSDE